MSYGATFKKSGHTSSRFFKRSTLVAVLLLSTSIAPGCATVVIPLKPGAVTTTDPNHGLVLGRIHLAWNGKEQRSGDRLPFEVKWRLTDDTLGTQFLIDHLPVDGPFLLELPTGSYRLTVVSFDNALGVWQASLPATFSVRPKECSYLGTWDLHMRTGFFEGSINRLVLDQHDLAQNDLRTMIGNGSWPPMVAQLSSPMESPLLLTFRTQGTALTSPP